MRKTKEEILRECKTNTVPFIPNHDNQEWISKSDAITAMQTFAQQDNWINEGDRLPEDGEDVLVLLAKYGKIERSINYDVAFRYQNKWVTSSSEDIENNSDYFVVTHWQPLPTPPNSTPST